jgi:hypothetical protein
MPRQPVAQRLGGWVDGIFDMGHMGRDELLGRASFINGTLEGKAWISDGPNAERGARRGQTVSRPTEQPEVANRSSKGIKATGKTREVTIYDLAQDAHITTKGDMQLIQYPVVEGGRHRGQS